MPIDNPNTLMVEKDLLRQKFLRATMKWFLNIDFIFDAEKAQPYMLEINTVPGQSAASIVPQQVNAMGWTLQDFYSALIEECFTEKVNAIQLKEPVTS